MHISHPSPAEPANRTRILVIDDTPANLMALCVMLDSEFDVQFAVSGMVGIALALANPPDLILLDVVMPEVDGFETFRRLSAQPSLHHIPVIFVTSMSDFDSEATGLALGAADFIAKPVNVVIARHRIHNLLERESLRKKVELQRSLLTQELALRTQAEAAQRKLWMAIEQSPVSVYITNTAACIEYVNTKFTEVTGYTAQEVYGKNPNVFQSGRTAPAIYREMWDTLSQERIWKGELLNRRKNGSVYWDETQIAPIRDPSGETITHYVAVSVDITSAKQAQEDLLALRAETQARESRQRMRDMVVHNEKIREEERKFVALELHDELGQVLTALKMTLQLMDMRFCANDPALSKVVLQAGDLLNRAIQGTRDIVFRLRPAALDLGLASGIEWQCAEFFKQSGVPCLLHLQEDCQLPGGANSIVVFRIVQESLTNSARYAQASRVDVTIRQHGGNTQFEIRDDGVGFDMAAVQLRKNTLGLVGMQERAKALGGHTEIDSAPGCGTTIRVTIPTGVEMHAATELQ